MTFGIGVTLSASFRAQVMHKTQRPPCQNKTRTLQVAKQEARNSWFFLCVPTFFTRATRTRSCFLLARFFYLSSSCRTGNLVISRSTRRIRTGPYWPYGCGCCLHWSASPHHGTLPGSAEYTDLISNRLLPHSNVHVDKGREQKINSKTKRPQRALMNKQMRAFAEQRS